MAEAKDKFFANELSQNRETWLRQLLVIVMRIMSGDKMTCSLTSARS